MEKLTYKKGFEKYTLILSNGLECQEEEKVYHVYQGANKIGFISNCEILKSWSFYKNIDSDYLCGGDTLKDAKSTLERCLSPEHWNIEETKKYFLS